MKFVTLTCLTPLFGDWALVDQWGPDGGRTFIFEDNVPIWLMRYYGKYPKNRIPLLKAALADRYKDGDFVGGRGPGSFEVPGEVGWYRNAWKGDFSNFSGRETISMPKTQPMVGSVMATVGAHDYWGGMLV
jgi:hypothetical protein